MADLTRSDLNGIELRIRDALSELAAIKRHVGAVHGRVDDVDDRLTEVQQRVNNVDAILTAFVIKQQRENRLGRAHTQVVAIRQELDKKFGHYDVIRRTANGILEANDLGIIRKETLNSSSEEFMITTPRYWLAPALVALSAWISDQQALADKAAKESMRRDEDKTDLFFALVCRRAERLGASLLWMDRYLGRQDEEKLNRQTVVLLGAYSAGLFGNDANGIISSHLNEWLDRLNAKPDFEDRQRRHWSSALTRLKRPVRQNEYPTLRQLSPTWSSLEAVLSGARMHRPVREHFEAIFAQPDSKESLKKQLDDLLSDLTTKFDDEELPLRRAERLEQLVIEQQGDEDAAKRIMDATDSVFDEKRPFTELLTDAAMDPEHAGVNPVTQKLAVSLSKDWIVSGYRDAVAQNRARIPDTILLEMKGFKARTRDGYNEESILQEYDEYMETLKAAALEEVKPPSIGWLVAAGVFALFGIWGWFWFIIAAIPVLVYMVNRSEVPKKKAEIEAQFAKDTEEGKKLIRRFMAEVVDYRREFRDTDAESDRVFEFFDNVVPAQFVGRAPDGNRRVLTNNGGQ